MKKSYEQAKRRRENGVVYKHDLGQHFLLDEELLARLTASTGVTKADRVLEIGPGSGMLTKCLCESAKQVIAVEVDEDVLPFLRVRTQNCDNLQIVVGDVRKLDLPTLCEPLGSDFFVIANIPYNITTPILDLLWQGGLSIRQASVMVQKEVADKLLAAPGAAAYGLTSVRCRYFCEARLEELVPAECFTPPPKVDSAFVHLVMRKEPPLPVKDEKRLFLFIRTSFGLRRKTLANALKSVADAGKLKAAMETLGLPPLVRGEELDIVQWIALSNLC